MQMCPECNRVYDESDNSKCPYCYPCCENSNIYYIVYDRDEKIAKSVPESEVWKYNYKD